MRRAMIVPLAVCALVAAGCASSIDGTPVAAQGVSETLGSAPTGPGASPGTSEATGVSTATDCDSLTEALGPLVSDRPEVSEQRLPGFDAPMCMWSKGKTNVGKSLTMIVKVEPHDPAVIEQMKTMGTTRADPRADALGGVVLDVIGFALLTPTHNILANSMDPGVDDEMKLDMVFAVAEYLEK